MNIPIPRDGDQPGLPPPIRKEPKKDSAGDVWRPHKPGFEINQRGELRTTPPTVPPGVLPP